MSAVRMCDRCGTVFPEGVDGSSVGTGTVFRRIDGRRVQEQVPQDFCGTCTQATVMPQFPQGPQQAAIEAKAT